MHLCCSSSAVAELYLSNKDVSHSLRSSSLSLWQWWNQDSKGKTNTPSVMIKAETET